MSIIIDEDGRVTFACQGCGKETRTKGRQPKSLPRGWRVVGFLRTVWDPETEARQTVDPGTHPSGDELIRQLAGHFCSYSCAKEVMTHPKIRRRLAQYRLAAVLYGKVEFIMDGSYGDRNNPPSRSRRREYGDDEENYGTGNFTSYDP